MNHRGRNRRIGKDPRDWRSNKARENICWYVQFNHDRKLPSSWISNWSYPTWEFVIGGSTLVWNQGRPVDFEHDFTRNGFNQSSQRMVDTCKLSNTS
jgi:hypothetical protein